MPWFDEPQVDRTVELRCSTTGCSAQGEIWHPEIFTEYQGERLHGGPVEFYVLDAFDCEVCGLPGEERKA